MSKYKSFRKHRYAFFWASILAFFIPYIVATSCLLPLVKVATGTKVGIGLAVILINALPFLGGIFHGVRAHFPFINVFAFLFVALGGFFCLDVFQYYVYTFVTIEAVALAGSIAACILWHYYRKYSKMNDTYKANKKIGVLTEE